MLKILEKITILCCCICLLLSNNVAFAAKKKQPKGGAKKIEKVIAPVETSLVIDARSGKILHKTNERTLVHPASLTKLATLYLTFEAIQQGRLSLRHNIPVSAKAEKVIPCKLWLRKGEYVSVKDAIFGTIIKSANDAAIALAEHIGGSEEKFAQMMTARARQLGMHNTVFKNSTGLHHPEQKTTALDLAKLAIAIKRDFPQYYSWFSETSFEFRGKEVNGHNRVLANYEGAEGLKTGFTLASGYNLITTASRSGKSLLAVVTGSKSWQSRDQKMVRLLDTHFGVVAQAPKKSRKTVIKTASR